MSIWQFLNWLNWASVLTSSRMCHPSCQNEPGNGCPPHRWRLLRRWATDSCDPQPPASSQFQNRTLHPSKQRQQTGSGDRRGYSAAVGSQHVSEHHRKTISRIKVWHISPQLKTFNIQTARLEFYHPSNVHAVSAANTVSYMVTVTLPGLAKSSLKAPCAFVILR